MSEPSLNELLTLILPAGPVTVVSTDVIPRSGNTPSNLHVLLTEEPDANSLIEGQRLEIKEYPHLIFEVTAVVTNPKEHLTKIGLDVLPKPRKLGF